MRCKKCVSSSIEFVSKQFGSVETSPGNLKVLSSGAVFGRLQYATWLRGLSTLKPSCEELEEKEAKVETVEPQSQEEVEVIIE